MSRAAKRPKEARDTPAPAVATPAAVVDIIAHLPADVLWELVRYYVPVADLYVLWYVSRAFRALAGRVLDGVPLEHEGHVAMLQCRHRLNERPVHYSRHVCARPACAAAHATIRTHDAMHIYLLKTRHLVKLRRVTVYEPSGHGRYAAWRTPVKRYLLADVRGVSAGVRRASEAATRRKVAGRKKAFVSALSAQTCPQTTHSATPTRATSWLE